jgi:hypothetical protein
MEQRAEEDRRLRRAGRVWARLFEAGGVTEPADETKYKCDLHALSAALCLQHGDPLPATRTAPITADEIRGRCDSARATLVDLHPWGADPDGDNDIPF